MQVHDYNGGIPPSGLFWTVEIPDGAFRVDRKLKRARLHVRELALIDTFTFLGENDTPAVLNMTIEWEAVEEPVALGSGLAVPPDPAAFLGSFARARSMAQISGRQLGFSFRTDPGASSENGGYAEIGTERNGVFL